MTEQQSAKQIAQQRTKDGGMTLMQGMVLDLVAEGKSPRQIAEVLGNGITPAEAAKMAYDLLDNEIVTDTDQRRKLQVYRLEKLVEALWQRTMQNANALDVKNLREVLADLNTLLALNKEQDAELQVKMHAHQFATYMAALKGLMAAFISLNPTLKTPEEWAEWVADQTEIAEKHMEIEA